MLNYHHQPRSSWADHRQLYCQVVVNQARQSTDIVCRNDTSKWRTNTRRRVERKTKHQCTQVRQSQFCITRRKRDALERLFQSATSQEATWWKRQMAPADAIVHIFESSDEPARPTQIVQQHVSDQPDSVEEADSQSGKEYTTQCVATTRSGCRVRVPDRYQHNWSGIIIPDREGSQPNERSSEMRTPLMWIYNECEHLCELIMNANTEVNLKLTRTFISTYNVQA